MKIGLLDIDTKNFPNLPLMKLSAWHKSIGDHVELYDPLRHHDPYDRVYCSKVFTFSNDYMYPIYAKEIIYGGTGYDLKNKLPTEVENMFPDYSLYNTEDTAYGFLTRGCPRQCDFCIVSQKEGCRSIKVANLDLFWKGQKIIKLLDPNLLACKDRLGLLQQLIDSKAYIDFTQGLDIRLVDEEITELIMKLKLKMVHFAWDFEKDSELIIGKLKYFKKRTNINIRKAGVYVLTNFNTSHDFDLYRIYTLRDMGFDPYVMIYDKNNAPKETRQMQRWVNNKFIFRSCERFEDYRARI